MLLEEISELQKEICKYYRNVNNEPQIMEEMADVLEVLLAICEARGHSIDELIQVRNRKRDKRGAFKEKIYWEGNR